MIPAVTDDSYGDENFHCQVKFDPTVSLEKVPVNASDFNRYYSPEDVQLFTMFEIVNSREESLFEFNLANKEYDKLQEKPVENRAARVQRLTDFYAANALLELSPFED
jgi:hypothetical protein